MAEAATLQLAIDGMTCASCAGRVERALLRVDGVLAASVNLASAKAEVQRRPGSAPTDVLVQAVVKAGYEAALVSADPLAAPAVQRVHDPGWRVAVAALLTAPLMLPMLAAPFGLHWMLGAQWQLLLAAPVQFWLGARFYRAGWHALRSGSGNMDLLVALGTSAAFGLSLFSAWRSDSDMPALYFESAATVITLVLFGKWLEARAKRRTLAALDSLRSLQPATACVLRDGQELQLPLAQVSVGDVVRVRPGERLPTDGTVLVGRSHVDESLLTGESLPVARGEGDRVTGGAINGEGLLEVRTTAVGAQTQLARIVQMVESAQGRKAPIQQLVDRVSAVFVPVVLGCALLTLLGWGLLRGDWAAATLHAVSVLVIACPCALGLATPATLMVGLGLAARRGILVRDPQALELMRAVRVVAFDKTGTLTEGQPRLQAVEVAATSGADSPPPVLAWAAALQAGSEHPLARAVLSAAQAEGLALLPATDVRAEPGRGISGCVQGRTLKLGSSRWLAELGGQAGALQARADALQAQGCSLAWLMEGEGQGEGQGQGHEKAQGEAAHPPVRLLGLLAFGDTARAGAAPALAQLRAMGVRTVLISGDNPGAAQALGSALGIDEVHAEVLPADKAAWVGRLRAQAQQADAHARVAMVGDGINDAPALAAADVGLAMGSGADMAREAAGMTLLRTDLALILQAISLSRAITAKLHQNLFWAFAYNVVGIPLAALGGLSPVWAGAAMALSSVSVVGNALLLGRWRPQP